MNEQELMSEALKEAQAAYDRGECPVGAVLVHEGKIVARDGNRELELHDPAAHAEILVLRQAGKLLETHTFPTATLYTTLWPCPMCENALLRARVSRIVAGARGFRFIYENTFDSSKLVRAGPVMEEECRGLFIRWLQETGREFTLEPGP